MSTATIRDVATRAGVTKPTVSRVLNNSAPVRPETRARVEAAIRELGYRPSAVARGLVRGRLHMIAVVVPFVTHPSVVARVRGMVNAFREGRIPVSIYDVEHGDDLDEHLAALTSYLRPEGVVVISLHPSPSQLERMRAGGIQAVFVDAEAPGWSSVAIDDLAGGMMATRHLLDLGHRRIGFIGDPENNEFGFTSSHLRRMGYRRALEASGVAIDAGLERSGPHGRQTAAALAGELLALAEPPTAIFAASDTQALGVLDAARQRGRSVPGDLSVIGFDDIEAAEYAGLTTVRQPLTRSGLEAATLLEAQMRDPHREPVRVELPLELVSRRTTSPHGAASDERSSTTDDGGRATPM
jgi:LacI family transcriptional regulator